MRWWRRWLFVWRFMRRELQAGELTLLFMALLVAVSAMSSVAFFSERVERGLVVRTSQLLAADLVVDASAPLPPSLEQEAWRHHLTTTHSITFPSMVMARDQVVLANIKALGAGYPLRGKMRVRLADGRVEEGRPQLMPGTAWVDLRLLSRLGLRLGDSLTVGRLQLRLVGEILREPDAAISLYNFVPRVMLSDTDLAATGLIQPGSRAHWRLLLAGDRTEVLRFAAWLPAHLPSGARLENVEEARPEVREALERARRFLGLTSMLTVALSAAAVLLAVRRYLARHWQAVAVLRCLGLTASEVGRLFAGLFLLLGLCGGLAGTVTGYGLQAVLAGMVPAGADLPAPGWLVWCLGPASALFLLAGLALPPLLAVRRVSPLAVLRVELPVAGSGVLAPALAVLTILLLSAWQIADARLAVAMFGAMAGFLAVYALLARILVLLLRRLTQRGTGIGWRYGAASLARRPWLTVLQVVALSVGIMALLTMTVVRTHVLDAWRQSLSLSAPNQFVLNLQPEQQADFSRHFTRSGRAAPECSPMLRARLLQINGRAVSPSAYRDGEARRLAEREFNLSWRDTLPGGNQVVSGRWWGRAAEPQFSVEQRLAEKLGIGLGDVLSFDVAGSRYDGRVTSLRAVDWGSFRVNFFVLASPGMFAGQRVSLVSSFHLEPDEQAFASGLVHAFPNVTLIDVGEILTQLREVVERLAQAVEALFVLSLFAGVLVLWSALSVIRDERLFDAGLLRALGASRSQIRVVILSELLWLGAFTGLLAGLGAMALGALAATRLFNLPLAADISLLPLGVGVGIALVPLAGVGLIRRVLRQAPAEVLRSL